MDTKTFQKIDKLIMKLRNLESDVGFEIGMGHGQGYKCKRMSGNATDIHMEITELMADDLDDVKAFRSRLRLA